MNSSFIHHSLQKEPLSTYYVGGPVLPKDTPGTKAKRFLLSWCLRKEDWEHLIGWQGKITILIK